MQTILDSITTGVKNWWWFIVKGLLLIAAGIAIFYWPAHGYAGLSVLFSIIILSTGFSQLFFSIANSNILKGWGWTLASGILDVVIGFYLLSNPAVTMVTLPYILGFWLMFGSFYLIGASIDLNSLGVKNWGWVTVGGVLTLVFAFLVLYYPSAGVVSIIAWAGSALIISGVFNFVLASKLKSIKNTATEVKQRLQTAAA
jgi:hypothetical protein